MQSTFWIWEEMHGRGLKVADANVFGIRVGVSINSFCEEKGEIHLRHRNSFTIAPMTCGTKNRSLTFLMNVNI